MHWRIEEWVDDARRGNGGKYFTVVEVSEDGSEKDVYTTKADEGRARRHADALAIQYRAALDLALCHFDVFVAERYDRYGMVAVNAQWFASLRVPDQATALDIAHRNDHLRGQHYFFVQNHSTTERQAALIGVPLSSFCSEGGAL